MGSDEHEFVDGEWAFTPRTGWHRVSSVDIIPNRISHCGRFYRKDGRHDAEDPHPSLLTVEQAAKLGHYPPKEKKKVEFECEWAEIVGVLSPYGPNVREKLASIGGKKTKVTVEYEE